MATLFASGSDWNTASHWGTTSGASDGSVPTGSDDAIFDANSVNMSLSAAAACLSIDLQAGFTAQLDQATFDLVVGSGGYTGTAGTYLGGTGSLTVGTTSAGDITLDGIAFTAPGTLLEFHGLFITAGSFTHNSGKVLKKRRNMTLDISVTFFEFESNSEGTNVVLDWSSGAWIINDNLTITSNHGVNVGASGFFELKGDLVVSNNWTDTGGEWVCKLNGTGDQSVSADTPSVDEVMGFIIDKSSGTLNIDSDIRMRGDIIYIQGSYNQNSNIITFLVMGTFDTNTLELGEVIFNSSGNIILDSDMIITGNCTLITLNTLQGTGNIRFRGGTFETRRTIAISSPNSSIIFETNAVQLLTSDNAGTLRYLPGVIFNNSGGLIIVQNIFGIGARFEYVAGGMVFGLFGSIFEITLLGTTPWIMSASSPIWPKITLSGTGTTNTGTLKCLDGVLDTSTNMNGGKFEAHRDLELNDTAVTGSTEIGMSGPSNGTLDAVASNDMPDGDFTIDKRRGQATLTSDVDGSDNADVTIKTGSTFNLDSFNFDTPNDLDQFGDIDTSGGGTITVTGTHTRRRSSFIGRTKQTKYPTTGNRIRRRNSIRTKRALV